MTQALSAEEAQRVPRPALADGTQAPIPTTCVVNVVRPIEGARLFLPMPPHYPDEVRARLWARGTGYAHGASTVCVGTAVQPTRQAAAVLVRAAARQRHRQPAGAASATALRRPRPGSKSRAPTPIMGTAQFDPAQVQYYKLEIGNGRSPTAWTTFGTTHSQPVSGGVLEQLQAGGLAPGDYIIRLVLVGQDGNFVGDPHYVPISVAP